MSISSTINLQTAFKDAVAGVSGPPAGLNGVSGPDHQQDTPSAPRAAFGPGMGM